MEQNYWSAVLTRRQLTRRRLLSGAAGVATGGAALSLIGCGGGGGDDAGVEGDASGLLGKAEDTTSKAIPGGSLPDYYTGDYTTLDPITNVSSITRGYYPHTYTMLFKSGLSTTKTPGTAEITGDSAQSWEMSEDGTQLTVKVRPNHKFDQRPPTNGRAMTSADIKWSWDQFEGRNFFATDLANSRNPDAPVESVTAPDMNTLVFKMASPSGIIVDLFSLHFFYVMPQLESFDFQMDMRGAGPYFLKEYRPSESVTFSKNPDWYESPRPYFDTIKRSLLPEYATGLAQFVAGNIWTWDARATDLIPTKRANLDMLMLPVPNVSRSASFYTFSKRDGSIWKDVRLRRALSMSMERDLLIHALNNLNEFETAGLPISTYWNSHVAAGQPEWLDPKGTGLGEGAKYFKFDLAEAKKLVEAAGLQTPVKSTIADYSDRTPERFKETLTIAQQITQAGVFNMEAEPLLYGSSWRAARQSGGMGFDGLVHHSGNSNPTGQQLPAFFTPNGSNTSSAIPIPNVTEAVYKLRGLTDAAQREALVHEIQKQLALEWPMMTQPGDAPLFTLQWPWLRNSNVFKTINPDTARLFAWMWYDKDLHERSSEGSK
ncbi:MAG: hypothetical protein GEU75_03685 [Dehalococcoidia bacterium]|nr:hypothetical protein [Dehalococcoidia bacterium]